MNHNNKHSTYIQLYKLIHVHIHKIEVQTVTHHNFLLPSHPRKENTSAQPQTEHDSHVHTIT